MMTLIFLSIFAASTSFADCATDCADSYTNCENQCFSTDEICLAKCQEIRRQCEERCKVTSAPSSTPAQPLDAQQDREHE
jgi:hypothetical protein